MNELKDKSIPQLPRQNSIANVIVSNGRLTEDDIKLIIRRMGIKVTHQRMAIFRVLYEGRAHVTAQEVFEKVRKTFSEVGFATVYRFMRNLADHNIVTEVRMGGMPARYELTSENHHDHLTCVSCGKICEFENPEIERLQEEVAQFYGFELTHHILELYGRCSDCKTD